MKHGNILELTYTPWYLISCHLFPIIFSVLPLLVNNRSYYVGTSFSSICCWRPLWIYLGSYLSLTTSPTVSITSMLCSILFPISSFLNIPINIFLSLKLLTLLLLTGHYCLFFIYNFLYYIQAEMKICLNYTFHWNWKLK